MLVLETFMVGVFAATDVFLFYVLFEAMLIPVYFLIGSFGGARRQYAAVKFLLFSLTGGLVMLVAVIALYFAGPRRPARASCSTNLTRAAASDPTTERLLFLGFFFAFAIKAPMLPVHTWLPDAAAEAPPADAVLLVGVLDKVGTFGMIRFCLPLFPEAAQVGDPGGLVLAVDLDPVRRAARHRPDRHHAADRLHLGQPLRLHRAGHLRDDLARASPARRCTWSTTASPPRRCSSSAAMLIRRRGSKRIPDFGGLAAGRPRLLAGVFLLAGLSGLSLPGLSHVHQRVPGPGRHVPALPASPAVIATLGIILAALYILLMYQRMMTGPEPENAAGIRDLTHRRSGSSRRC